MVRMPVTTAAASSTDTETRLDALSELLHARAEIFANPSIELENGTASVHKQTLEAVKYLFDASLQYESKSLPALANLYSNVRNDDNAPGSITTRSKASRKAATNKKNKVDNPIFQQTPLPELYLGEKQITSNGSTTAAYQDEILQKMIWEQLEMKIGKVLSVYREIVHGGDESGDDEAPAEDDDDEDEEDSDELDEEDQDLLDQDGELMDGLDDDEDADLDEDASLDLQDEDDEDMLSLEEEHEDDVEARVAPEPYFSKLRDAEEEDEENEMLEDEEETPKPSKKSKKSKKGKSVAKDAEDDEPAVTESSNSLDGGFFSLSDFHSQMRQGEDEMKRYMRSGKSKSAADLQDRLEALGDEGGDESEDEEIDYFAAPGGADGMDGEDEEGDEDDDELRPEDMTYKDFWNAPKAIYGSIPGSKKRNDADSTRAKANGKPPKRNDKKESKAVNGQSATADAERPSAAKRRVSFQDQVKVQEFESAGNNKSAIAALVKKVGMKQALKKLSSGELDDEDVEGLEGEDDDENMEEGNAEDDEEDGSEEDENEEEEDDDEDDDDDASMADSDGGDAEARTMRRLQNDLLADDDDANSSKKDKSKQSRYEQRMAALSEQIAELEQENVAEREWAMRGEINSRARPVNSLLEEDLEFDQVAKVVPVVTEESSLTLEDKIKKRILDEQFDDVIRKRAGGTAAYLPSRLLDVQSTQNERSLADIYADEFSAERARAAGEPGKVPEIDSKLQKEHDLLSTIFDEVCNKLDALSNAHFTPKQAQTTITTISNLPSISLESALPTASSTATLLAPEEVYAPTQSQLVAKSEMTPSQKKAARVKARKARQTTQKSIEKYGGGSAKNQKERAMNSLIGKRGVIVVGKGKAAKSALTGKDRKSRGAGQEAPQHSGTALKL